VPVFKSSEWELESARPSGSIYQSDRGECFLRTLRRIAAKVHPVAVRKTPIVTMKVIATTKAMTVGTAAAIAEGFLSRINVQFKSLCSPVRSITP
jgi:hypothetical protein